MKQRTRPQRRLIALAFAGMLALFALLLWQGVRRGDAVRVGIPRAADAYGAAMLLQTPSAQYHCVLGSTAPALAAALEAGELDAALLPYDLARAAEGCEIRAVLGYEPLLILASSDDAPGGLSALNGRQITLAEDARGSRAERMLRAVLREAGVRCEIVYGDAGELMACGVDAAEAMIRRGGWRVILSVSQAWRQLLGAEAPAGLCLVVRQDYLRNAGADFDAFCRALRSAQQYGDEKRKKTAAMAVAAGLADSEETADALYPWIDFVCLTDEEMYVSLRAVE